MMNSVRRLKLSRPISSKIVLLAYYDELRKETETPVNKLFVVIAVVTPMMNPVRRLKQEIIS